MYRFLLCIPVFALVWLNHTSVSAGRELVKKQVAFLPRDTVLLQDTVLLNDQMLIVSRTLKITDTTSRPVIVNGEWMKKRIKVIDYVSLPSDTIRLNSTLIKDTKQVTSSKQTATNSTQTETIAPDKLIVTKEITPTPSADNHDVKIEKEIPVTPNKETISDDFEENNRLSEIVIQDKISTLKEELPDTLRKVDTTEKTIAENVPVLKPTTKKANSSAQNNHSKKTKASKKQQPSSLSEVKSDEENSLPLAKIPDQASNELQEVQPIMQVEPKEILKPDLPVSDPLQDVFIEVIDERRVIGMRTDLPEDHLPPGGTLLIVVEQPNESGSPVHISQNSEGKGNLKLPPFAPPIPEKDKVQPPAPNKSEPVQINHNTDILKTANETETATTNAPKTPSPERIVIESKPVTLSEAYQLTLNDIQKQREQFAKQYKKAKNEVEADEVLLLAGRYLEEVIANDIVYYWYGTGFDKEGMSSSPGSGRIACSYFVVTMLTESGLNIDRVKLSQQSALNIVKTLSTPDLVVRCNSPDEVESLLQQKGGGLYFIGFNYHVGFLYFDGREIHLIHASPLPPGTVSRISMKGAKSFEYSNYYDIGKLTDNKNLIVNWLTGKKLQIIQ